MRIPKPVWLWSAWAALAALLYVAPASARPEPYYILAHAALDQVRPQALLVLDTSNSMRLTAVGGREQCRWSECEVPNAPDESRISVVRRAMQSVIASVSDVVNLSLMTFDQWDTPTTVPGGCQHVSGEQRRFMFMDRFVDFIDGAYVEFTPDIVTAHGFPGAWALCQGEWRHKFTFPYLRWDDLGVGSPISSQVTTDPLPPSPLISTDPDDYRDPANGRRKVQWFPRFMGVRANLNATTDPGEIVLGGTIGDYGTSAAPLLRRAAVWGHDFYYWPYVDGMIAYAETPGIVDAAEFPAEAGVSPHYHMGVTRGPLPKTFAGRLYVPFYLDGATFDTSGIAANELGAPTAQAAVDEMLGLTDVYVRGGLEPSSFGITPWADTIGALGPVASNTNDYGSHATVASYLKFLSGTIRDPICTPLIAILITDGSPAPGISSPDYQGGPQLHARLADLRRVLGVRVYVVGVYTNHEELNSMACAGAGACDGLCDTPCDDVPARAWDTCADPSAPETSCAYRASSPEGLSQALLDILKGDIATSLDAGPVAVVNRFDGDDVAQLHVTAHTEWPSWRGHVRRLRCTDSDPSDPKQLAPWCLAPVSSDQPTFGPCAAAAQWDAGTCLEATAWNARRLYTSAADGARVALFEPGQTQATPEFAALLVERGLVKSEEASAVATDLVAFLAGRDAPEGWKLPGLANSAPTVIRRIPRVDHRRTPAVGIRDPHCAGRRLAPASGDQTPVSLATHARDAWTPITTASGEHYAAQEGVLVGDDLGILHAFQLESGNELWGYLPPMLLAKALDKMARGADNYGQPYAPEDHVYGVAGTANHAWTWDAAAGKWRHVAVIAMGAGAPHAVALDVSHMSPEDPAGPFEVLWTTEDADRLVDYTGLGKVWARPSLSYHVPGDHIASHPQGRVLFAGGYAKGHKPRPMLFADLVTGQVLDRAEAPAVDDSARFDTAAGFAADPAIASRCISRFWAEAQEAYLFGSDGRVFRWDLERSGAHAADSGGPWSGGTAVPAMTLPACVGTDRCEVSVAHPGDPFLFAPAVTGLDRLDHQGGASAQPPTRDGRVLAAAVSGGLADVASFDPRATTGLHSSLYLLVDDHRVASGAGFSVPLGAPLLGPTPAQGATAQYMRVAVSDLTRTREFQPFPGAPTYTETRRFHRNTRPLRAPRIQVQAAAEKVDGETVVRDDVEFFTITYTVYEPSSTSCDARWYDAGQDVLHFDEGATYEITFRLTASASSGFNFITGAGADMGFGGDEPGLALVGVEQVRSDDCSDGVCGPKVAPPRRQPCEVDDGASLAPDARALPVFTTHPAGWTPGG